MAPNNEKERLQQKMKELEILQKKREEGEKTDKTIFKLIIMFILLFFLPVGGCIYEMKKNEPSPSATYILESTTH